MRAIELVCFTLLVICHNIFNSGGLHSVHILAWWDVRGLPHPLLLLLGISIHFRVNLSLIRWVDIQLSDSLLLLNYRLSTRGAETFHNLIQLTRLFSYPHRLLNLSLFRTDQDSRNRLEVTTDCLSLRVSLAARRLNTISIT